VDRFHAGVALHGQPLMAVAAVGLALAGARRINVTLIGKAGTFGLMCAFPLFLTGHSTVAWHHTALVLAWATAIIGLVLGWTSVVVYVPLARGALAEGRTAGGGERGASKA
jgi:cardiolipin synthase (CMP-forming)